MASPHLADWAPIRLYWQQTHLRVDWGYLGKLRFIDPFFEQTIGEALRHPFALLFRHQTSIDLLTELSASRPGVTPKGFIFHMSRCGSTLLSQMLASLPQNIVISEAPPIDTVLRAHLYNPAITGEQRVAWLQGMVSVLGQRRFEEEEHLFIKFDCWHTLDLPLIRQAFPHVPCIFLYRDPLEVLVSQLKMPGIQMLPGFLDPSWLGLQPDELLQIPVEVYRARVLALICQAALTFAQEELCLLVNYRHMPEIVWERLLPFWGLNHGLAEINQMGYTSQFNAKQPSLTFVADSKTKQQEASETVRQVAEQWLYPLYTRLEAQCHAQTRVG